jgi:hypothetical protein
MTRRLDFLPARESIRAAANQSANTRLLSYPLGDNNYGLLMLFREYQYARPGNRNNRGFASAETTNIKDSILLPIPSNLADSFEIRVQRADQGLMASIASETISNVTSNGLSLELAAMQGAAASAITEMLPESLKTGTDFFNLIKNLGKSVIGKDYSSDVINQFSSDVAFLGRKMLPGAAGRAVDLGTGTMLNPKASLSFEGMELKNHSFDWTLYPKSDRESNLIRDITQTIKRNVLPRYVEGEVAKRALFRYPSTVDLLFVGLDSDYYYYFKTSMVRSFNVNYAPNGVSVIKGNRPSSVQIQLSLVESDIHTAEDYGADPFTLSPSPPAVDILP